MLLFNVLRCLLHTGSTKRNSSKCHINNLQTKQINFEVLEHVVLRTHL